MGQRGEQDAGETVSLRIEIAGRPIGHVRRRLRIVAHGLDAILSGEQGDLPPPGRDGWLLRSMPAARLAALESRMTGWLLSVRQLYPRHHILMEQDDFDGWWQGFSGKTRSTLSRKARRLADRFDGGFTVRAYRSADEIAEFMPIAAALSARTYQQRLMQAGLPTGGDDIGQAIAAAGEDKVRAFLLFAEGRAIAYLYLPVERDILVYAHLGYDPDYADLSPGTVLHVDAMRQLYAEGRFRAFDFTEGDGAHKAQFGRASVACADVLLLRPSLGNRAALGMLCAIDGLTAGARRLLDRVGLRAKVKAIIRR